MEFLRNKGCLVEIIISIILGVILLVKVISGISTWESVKRNGTEDGYRDLILQNKLHSKINEATDSIISIYDRAQYSPKVIAEKMEQYRRINSPTYGRIKEYLQKKVDGMYSTALSKNTFESWRDFVQSIPEDFQKDAKTRLGKVEPGYKKAEQINTIEGWLSYIKKNKEYALYTDATQRLEKLCEAAYNRAYNWGTVYAWKNFKKQVPKEYWKDADERIEKAQLEEYKNNQLETGDKPWSSYYGWGSSGNSFVEVSASPSSDVVVVVKYNNENGKVANHVYIRRHGRYRLTLPSGNYYQVFFYSGKGWHPEKVMKGSMKGGFISGSWTKDGEPFYLSRGQGYTYTLTETVNGNFSTSGSNMNEVL